MTVSIYDLWTYFRMGFATYTSKPISVLNMILLLVISVSNDLSIFLIILISLAVVILSILFGYVHYKRSKIYQTDTWINYENSPVAVGQLVSSLGLLVLICQHNDLEIPKEIRDFYEYFIEISKQHNYERILKKEEFE